MGFSAHRTSSARTFALLVAGALALHELRYLLDPGAGGTLWASDHAYLTAAAPLLVGLGIGAVAASVLAGALGARRRGRPAGAGAYVAALLGIHAAQESSEGLLAGAGPAELAISLLAAAAFAIPLALALGGLLAPLARALDGAEKRLGSALAAPVRLSTERGALAPCSAEQGPPRPLLARPLCPRGPPLGSTV